MQIQQIDDTVALDGLREEWNALLENSAANSVFLTWEWLRTWWKYLAERRELRVIALRHGGELIGVAPLGIRRASLRRLFPFRSIDFLGSGTVGSDYLDLIVRQGWEAEALDAFSQSLGQSRMLELSRLQSRAQAIQFAGILEARGWKAEIAQSDTCPFVDLRGHSWASYLASLGGEHRYNVRRKMNALNSHFEVSFEQIEDVEKCGPALRLLIELHQKRWQEHGQSDAFHTEGHVNFHNEFAIRALRRGWLRLFLLRLDGRPASAVYALRYGPTFYFYQSGFDPQYSRHSVGVVAMALSIKHAIEEGVDEYDFLHGDESYKFHWARESRFLARIRLFPPGRRGRCYQAVLNGRSRMRDWLRPPTGNLGKVGVGTA